MTMKNHAADKECRNENDKDASRADRTGASSSSISYAAYAASFDDKQPQQRDDVKGLPSRHQNEFQKKDHKAESLGESVLDNSVISNKDPGSRYRLSQAQQGPKTEASGDEVALSHFEPTDTPHDAGVVPGAVRVAGPGVDLTSDREEDDTFDIEMEQQANPTIADTTSSQAPQHQGETLLQAELVTPSSNDGKEMASASAIPVHPWKTRLSVAVLVCILVALSVGIAVPLTKRSSSPSPPATLAPSTSFPSSSPTTTPAPTSQEQITVVVGLDSKPRETGWKLDCDGTNRANFPIGVYDERSANRNLTAQFPVTVGQECTFVLEDAGGDGLEDGRFFRIHYGQVYSSNGTLLANGDGNFTSKTQVDFTMVAPLTQAPTTFPSASPTTTFRPSLAPSVSPTISFVPSIFPTRDPTSPPTAAPTTRPTPAPTLLPTQLPTSVPTFALTSRPTPFGTIIGPPPPPGPPSPSPRPTSLVATSQPTPAPTSFPTKEPEGFKTIPPTPYPMTQHPTRFPTRAPTLSPTVSPTPSIPVKLTVVIQLDEYPSETGWSMVCDDTVLIRVNPSTYARANERVTEVLTTRAGASCIFEISDSFGDGICCKFETRGFYQLFFGEDTSDRANLITSGDEFGASEAFPFQVREPVG